MEQHPQGNNPLASYNAFDHAPATLHNAITVFKRSEALANPDITLPLKALRMNDDGLIEVLQYGAMGMTDWSRKQLSSLVGIRWDKWFQRSETKEQAEEINWRFQRIDQEIKIRSSMEGTQEERANATIRAFVSPGYTPIPDSAFAQTLLEGLEGIETDFSLTRSNVTEKSVSYVVKIGENLRLSREVGDIWGGLLVRNSDVGYAGLKAVLHLTRLICRNGMTVPIKQAILISERHWSIDLDRIKEKLLARIPEIPGLLKRAGETIEIASTIQVDDVPETMGNLLRRTNLPKRMLAPILASYSREPQPTVFGVISAITHAAQQFPPEERLELEEAASQFLRVVN